MTGTHDHWREAAACQGIAGREVMFGDGTSQRQAKVICWQCTVRVECLAEALDNQIDFGVWGGMTERERRALLRRRPDITTWADVLGAARDSSGRPQAG
ncbi:WhiB family transcriptional regulator [Streptomyces sp. NPDC090080]|uniref:WhiB family transcriptional regulator n=1 Tax=Streptomyces sp. NPDC090080 TaxID=3365939 RepID=UPI003811FF8E